jgi:hypothetical protein
LSADGAIRVGELSGSPIGLHRHIALLTGLVRGLSQIASSNTFALQQPDAKPALVRLSAIISQYFNASDV